MSNFKFCPVCTAPLGLHVLDEVERLVCTKEDCNFIYYNNPLPVVAGLIRYEDKILLARNAKWPEKMMGLITGFLENGESPEEGIIREAKEETNLDLSGLSLIGNYSFIQKNELIIAFFAEGHGTIKLSEELVEYKLIPPEKLRPWPYATGLAVKDWLDSNGYKN